MCLVKFQKRKRVYCKFKACLGLWSLCTHTSSPYSHLQLRWCLTRLFSDALCTIVLYLCHFWPLDEEKALTVITGASSVRAPCSGPCPGRLFVWLLSFLSCQCLLSDTCVPADTGASWGRVFSSFKPFPVYSMSPYRRFDITFVTRPNLTSLALALGTV